MSTPERILAALIVVMAWLFVPALADGFHAPRVAVLLLATSVLVVLSLPGARRVWDGAHVSSRIAFIAAGLASLWVAGSVVTSDAVWMAVTGTAARGVGAITVVAALAAVVIVPIIGSQPVVRRRILQVLALAIGGIGALALLQFIGAVPLELGGQPGRPPVSTLGNPNFTAAAVSLGAPLVLYLWLAHPRHRRLTIGLGVVVLTALIAADSLLGWVAVTAGLLAFAIARFGTRWHRPRGWIIAVTPLATPIAGLAVVAIGSAAGSATAQVRTLAWEAGGGMVATHPVTGVGVGRSFAYYHQFRPPASVIADGPDRAVDSSHAWLVDLAATLGLVGVVLYVSLLVAAGLALRAAWLGTDEAKLDRTQIACVVGLLAGHGAQSSISVPTVLTVWLGGLFIGLALASTVGSIRRHRRSRQHPGVIAVALLLVAALAVPTGRWMLAARDLGLAQQELFSGRPTVADGYVGRAVDLAGWWPEAWLTAAHVAEELQDLPRAREVTIQAYDADPRERRAIVGKAIIAAVEGDHDQAEQWYDLAVEYDPYGFRLHFDRAEWALQNDREEIAEASLDVIEVVVHPSMPEWDRLQELRAELS